MITVLNGELLDTTMAQRLFFDIDRSDSILHAFKLRFCSDTYREDYLYHKLLPNPGDPIVTVKKTRFGVFFMHYERPGEQRIVRTTPVPLKSWLIGRYITKSELADLRASGIFPIEYNDGNAMGSLGPIPWLEGKSLTKKELRRLRREGLDLAYNGS